MTPRIFTFTPCQRIAEELDSLEVEEREKLPLFGIPVTLKENLQLKGYAVTVGCDTLVDNVACTDSSIYRVNVIVTFPPAVSLSPPLFLCIPSFVSPVPSLFLHTCGILCSALCRRVQYRFSVPICRRRP